MSSTTGRLPRRARLGAGREYTGRFARRLQGQWYQVLARPNRLARPRLGLIVGRRAAARAVDRSLAKRLAREEFRKAQGEIPALDVVVRLKTAVQRPDRLAARKELHELLACLQS